METAEERLLAQERRRLERVEALDRKRLAASLATLKDAAALRAAAERRREEEARAAREKVRRRKEKECADAARRRDADRYVPRGGRGDLITPRRVVAASRELM